MPDEAIMKSNEQKRSVQLSPESSLGFPDRYHQYPSFSWETCVGKEMKSVCGKEREREQYRF